MEGEPQGGVGLPALQGNPKVQGLRAPGKRGSPPPGIETSRKALPECSCLWISRALLVVLTAAGVSGTPRRVPAMRVAVTAQADRRHTQQETPLRCEGGGRGAGEGSQQWGPQRSVARSKGFVPPWKPESRPQEPAPGAGSRKGPGLGCVEKVVWRGG